MKKKSKLVTGLANLDPIERLKIQQRQSEADVTSMIKLPYAGGKPDKERDYQGPMTKGAGSGTKDRMPGTQGYTFTTPNAVERLMDFLKIRKFKPKKQKLKPPTKRSNPMSGII